MAISTKFGSALVLKITIAKTANLTWLKSSVNTNALMEPVFIGTLNATTYVNVLMAVMKPIVHVSLQCTSNVTTIIAFHPGDDVIT